MAFAVASKRAPLAVAGLLKKLLLAAPSASGAAPAPAAAALRPACVATARRLFSTGGAPFRRDDFESEEYSGDEEEYSGDEDVVYNRLRSRGFSVSMFSSAGTYASCSLAAPFPLVCFNLVKKMNTEADC
jgi:HSP20 family protein